MTDGECVHAEHEFNVSLGNSQDVILCVLGSVQEACTRFRVSHDPNEHRSIAVYETRSLLATLTIA